MGISLEFLTVKTHYYTCFLNTHSDRHTRTSSLILRQNYVWHVYLTRVQTRRGWPWHTSWSNYVDKVLRGKLSTMNSFELETWSLAHRAVTLSKRIHAKFWKLCLQTWPDRHLWNRTTAEDIWADLMGISMMLEIWKNQWTTSALVH